MQNINLKTNQEPANVSDAYTTYSRMQSKMTMQGTDAFDAVEQVQYDRTDEIGTTAQTVMDHFEEYRRDMQEKAKAEQQQEAGDKKQAREDAREIARSLSAEEIKKLRMMGVDVDSASLSDLAGIVSTMRDASHMEDLANVLAQARVEAGDVSDLVFTSTGPQIAGTDVDLKVGNKEILYLLKNKMPLNQENLYKAHYSGQRDVQGEAADRESRGSQTAPELPQSIQRQMQRIIAQAGILVDEVSMRGAAAMLAEDIPVTTDSMRSYMDMQAKLGAPIEALPTEAMTDGTDAQEIEEKAEQLCRDVAKLTDADVIQAVQEDRPVTIAAMIAGERGNETDAAQASLRAVTALRQMEEIRLSMTQQAAVRMLKADINIDTRDLSQVVARLRSVEAQMAKELFAQHGIEATDAMIADYTEMQTDLRTIGDAPASKLGLLLARQTVSVRSFATLITETDVRGTTDAAEADRQAEPTIRRPAEFARMEREYDALGTAPRADMGDSIRKAFTNIDAILADMNLPADEEHVRAVRILGYNSIAITDENLQQVLQYDREINDLLAACRPGAVLAMIKDGIRPLDMPVDALVRTLRERNYQAGVKETDDFATFLRDVERRGEISQEARAGYIGMFRVMKKLEQSGDREAGYLFANGSRLTVRNLITAMRSRKAAGIDVSVDAQFGMLDEVHVQGTKMDAQIASAFSEEHNPWQKIEDSRTYAQAAELLQAQNLEESAVNIQAAEYILQGAGAQENTNLYTLLSRMMQNVHWEDHTTEDAVDEETGAMAQSLAGGEIQLPFEPDTLLQQLQQGGDLSLTYADLQQQLVEQMYAQAEAGSVSENTLKGWKVVQAGFRILGTMAKRHQYQLPVPTESGTTLVNLTLQTDEKKRGTIEILLPTRQFGTLAASIHMDAQGQCTGTVSAETADENKQLSGYASAFESLLSGSEYADAEITLGAGRTAGIETADDLHMPADTEKLCRMAVFFVKALAKFSDI